MQASLRYQIAQMLLLGFEGKQIDAHNPIAQAITEDGIGGVILFDYHFPSKQFDKNIESPAQVKKLNQSLQDLNKQARALDQQPFLPLLISVDYEGGKVNRLKESYGFPPTISAEQAGNMSTDEVLEAANIMGKTLSDTGFNLDFAPVVDVNVNPNNPILGKLDRCFSADPEKVSTYAKLYTQAFSKHGIHSVYKHFPGHGSSHDDSHLGFVDVTDTWQDYELLPYQALFQDPDACQMIMTAHIINRKLDSSGLPATLSYKILSELLRDQLHYQGIVITDDMQMKAIVDNYNIEEAVTLAINAGADMLIFGNQLSANPQDSKSMIDFIESQVRNGKIALETIQTAYARIVRFKQRF
ncbi:MAG: glycoside hydrolase family 3 protein [Gammaproteobacteria bacterium]